MTLKLSNELVDTSTEIERYMALLDSYGTATVVLSVFIVVFLIIFMLLLKNNHNTTKQLMDQQQQLFDIITNKNEEMDSAKKQHIRAEKNLVETFVKIDDSIKSVLKKINEEINASRLSIYVFHNGSYTSHGIPFFKVSCISEIIKKGTGLTSRTKAHNGLPLSMFNNSMKTLFNDGKFIIDNTSNIEQDYPVLHSILTSANIECGCGVAIYDDENNILGVIIAEFKNKDDSNNIDKVVDVLIEHTTFLTPILQSKSREGEQ